MMDRLFLAMFILSACADPKPEDSSALPRCDISTPERTTLSTQGRRIVDESGREILLRGINAGGRSKFAPFSPFDFDADNFQEELDAYLDRPVEWGLNVLRVPFSWDAMEPERGVIDEEWMSRYDALLDGAAQRGLYTIVDFHQDVYSERYCGDGFPIWSSPGGEERSRSELHRRVSEVRRPVEEVRQREEVAEVPARDAAARRDAGPARGASPREAHLRLRSS